MSTVVEKVIYLADAYRRHGIKVTVFFCLCPIKICDILTFFYLQCCGSGSESDSDVPDPHVFGPSGSGSISQRYGSGSGSGSFFHLAKIVIKTLIPNAL